MHVKVYSKAHCPQCDATKRFLTRREIPYEEIRMDLDPAVLQQVKDWGFAQAPVVDFRGTRWSGHRPDLMRKHLLGENLD